MKLKFYSAVVSASLGLFLSTTSWGAITVADYYKLGDADPGAVVGSAANAVSKDSGPSTRDVTSSGAPLYVCDVGTNATARAGSRIGMSFNGTSQYLSVAAGIIANSTNNFGLEAWVKASTTTGNHCIAYNGNTVSSGWGLYQQGNQFQGLFGGFPFIGSATLTTNVWTHLAIVRNNGTNTFYVNGVAAGATTTSAPASPVGGFGIATPGQSHTNDFFNGSIDEVRFFTFTAGQFSTTNLLVNATAVTPPLPSILAQGSGGITAFIAGLNATANPNGASTTVKFEYGVTTSYGSTSSVVSIGSLVCDVALGVTVSNLLPGTTYHYRTVAVNSTGTSNAVDATFTTLSTLTVTNLNDSGAGSLRQAIVDANTGGGAMVIDLTGRSGTLTLSSGLPPITNGMTINGSGSNNLTISGANLYRPFFVNASNRTITINNVKVANGRAKGGDGGLPRAGGGAGLGGGIFVNAGNAVVSGIQFANNAAAGGNGASTSSSQGAGGGGGLGGAGGSAASSGGGGGGGYVGVGGNGAVGGGGGGGYLGKGGIGSIVSVSAGAGGGGGGTVDGADASSSTGGAGGGGGGKGSDVVSGSGAVGGSFYGGGGGASSSFARAGDGGVYGGGGGGGLGSSGSFAAAGAGGDFGGGGGHGSSDAAAFNATANGGFGGGGGGGHWTSWNLPGGNGGFGGGGGGGPDSSKRGSSVAFGGSGGYFVGNPGAAGGGGAALGGDVFVRPNNGASFTAVDCDFVAGTLTAGTGGAGSGAQAGGAGQSSGTTLFLGGGTNTLTVNSGTKTLAGTITEWSSTTNTIIKNGVGTLLLSGTNSCTGTTFVTAGALQVNGLTGSLDVTNGATVSGSGTVGTLTLSSGGIVSPGASAGTLTASSTIWSGAGNYNWQIYNCTGTAGVDYDLLNVSGTLTVSAASGFKINVWSLSSPGVNGNAINFDFRATNTWVIAQTTGGVIGFNAANFNIITNSASGTTGFSNATFNGKFNLSVVANNLALTYSPALPIATTTAATSVGITTATLNASVDGAGNTTAVYFQYGTTASYGSYSTTNSITGAATLTKALSGLTSGTLYHFRAVAANTVATNFGGDLTFTTTPGIPVYISQGTNSVGATNASLFANINPNGGTTAVYFKYGLTTNYGSFSSTNSISGNAATNVSSTLTGLSIQTTYHYSVLASNSTGGSIGPDSTFTTTAGVPSVISQGTNSVGTTNASLFATINPNGATTAVYFQYGLTTNYGSFSSTNSISGSTVVGSTNALNGLSPQTTYHYAVLASNSTGVASGVDATFTTAPAAPSIIARGTNSVGVTNASVYATVNPNGPATAVYFKYGITTNYGNFSVTDSISGSAAISVTNTLAGLSSQMTYHYAVFASNSVGSTSGVDATFTTAPPPPSVVAQGTNSVTATNAVLFATVNPNGFATTVYFQYGTNLTYGSTSATNSPISGFSATGLTNPITGLLPGTIYFYRTVASSSAGTSYGNDDTFTTPPLVPLIVSQLVTNVTATSADLSTTVNPGGGDTTVYIQYGTTTNYGTATETNSLVAGTTSTTLPYSIIGLSPGATYHFATVAANSAGTTIGGDLVFTTSPLVVVNTNDSGAGSLRQAILDAGAYTNAGIVISNTVTGTIYLGSALPTITKGMTINGPGTTNLTISGSNLFRPFFLDAPGGAAISINGVTIADGLARGATGGFPGGGGAAGLGGGIFINNGSVTLSNVVFAGNQVIGGNGDPNGGPGDWTGGTGGNFGSDDSPSIGLGGVGGFVSNGGMPGCGGGTDGGGGGYGAGAGRGGYGYSCSSYGIYGNGGNGGTGGFGAGGGGGGGIYPGVAISIGQKHVGTGGVGGFGGGNGGKPIYPYAGAGGGGAAMGGSIFVRKDALTLASLTLVDCSMDVGTLTGGLGSSVNQTNASGSGSGLGSSIFFYGGTNTITVSSGTNTIAGTVGGWSGAPSTLVKNGAGTLLLSSTSTSPFSTLTLKAGKVLVGSTLGIIAVTVESGGTMPALVNGIGSLNESNTVWTGAGNYNWRLSNATGSAGSGFDVITVSGSLNVSNASGFNINLWTLSSLSPQTSGNALNFSSSTARSWAIITTTGGILGYAPSKFNIVTSPNNGTGGFSNSFSGTFYLTVSGNNLVLNYSPAVPPSPGVTSVSAITNTSALLTGTVSANGLAGAAYFEYGLTTNYGSSTAVTNYGSSLSQVIWSQTISGLQPSTVYHCRLVGTNAFGIGNGSDVAFTTLGPPILVSQAASNVGLRNAKLNGSVTPNGGVTTFYFEYGIDTNYGSVTTTSTANATPPGSVAVSANLTNLTVNTTYHFRISGTNGYGSSTSGDLTFTTLTSTAPTVTTAAATSVASFSAMLNGVVNPNGALSSAYFQYGLTTNYGNTTAAIDLGNSYSDQAPQASINNLTQATVYNFRVVATNSVGTNFGANLMFTTTASSPAVAILPTTSVTGTNATLNGSVDGNGAATTVYFEYGATTNYGNVTPTNAISDSVLALNGASQYVNCGPGINLANVSFSIEAWARRGAAGAYHLIVGQAAGGAPNAALHVGFRDTGTFAFAFWANDLDTPVITDTNWHHWACTYDSSNRARNIYRDGIVVASDTATANFQGSGDFWIGGFLNGNFFVGNIDEVRVWNTALSEDTILTWMKTPITAAHPNYATLAGSWSMNEGAGTTTTDASGLGHTGTLVNGVSWTNRAVNSGTVQATITGLTPTTTYHHRLVASNSVGIAMSSDLTFATVAAAPTAITLSASSISTVTAMLNASVNPEGTNTAVYFRYGTTTNYDQFSPTNNLTPDTSAVLVTNAIAGLLPNTSYHFQIVAENSVGTNSGQDLTFQTLANTNANLATLSSDSSAITPSFNAGVTNYTAAVSYFTTNAIIYASTEDANASIAINGFASAYGTNTATVPLVVGNNSIPVTVLAQDGLITLTYTIAIERAAPALATITNVTATNPGYTNVTLNASVNPNATATTVSFEYGPDAVYGNNVSIGAIGNDTNLVIVTTSLTNLAVGVSYHYRVVAVNEAGTNHSGDFSFSTVAAPKLDIIPQINGSFVLTFSGLAGVNYTLHKTTNLSLWLPFTNISAGTNGLFQLIDSNATNDAKSFYRLSNP